MKKTIQLAIATVPLVLAACASTPTGTASAPAAPAANPAAAIEVPAGNKAVLTLRGTGLLTYECRAKGDAFEWAFVSPDAVLRDKETVVGKYYGGPTWEHNDGSKVTGKQLAVAPASPGNIPLQLVQANPATGTGAFTGVTYIQRINTNGGVAPTDPCNAQTVGTKKTNYYAADYVFYKP